MKEVQIHMEDGTSVSVPARSSTRCIAMVSAALSKAGVVSPAHDFVLCLKSDPDSSDHFEFEMTSTDFPVQIIQRNLQHGQHMFFRLKKVHSETVEARAASKSTIIPSEMSPMWSKYSPQGMSLGNIITHPINQGSSSNILFEELNLKFAGKAEMFGYVFVIGKRRKHRFLLLNKTTLYFYKTHRSRNPKKTINVSSSIISHFPEGGDNCFEIVTSKKVFRIMAEDRKEMVAWMCSTYTTSNMLAQDNKVLSTMQHEIDQIELNKNASREAKYADLHSLRFTLNDEESSKALLAFLKSIHCEENLLFHISVEKYKAGKETASNIFSTYLRQGSRYEIALQAAVRDSIEAVVLQPDSNYTLFDEAQGIVLSLMENNVFPQYIASNFFLHAQLFSEISICKTIPPDEPFSPEFCMLQYLYSAAGLEFRGVHNPAESFVSRGRICRSSTMLSPRGKDLSSRTSRSSTKLR